MPSCCLQARAELALGGVSELQQVQLCDGRGKAGAAGCTRAVREKRGGQGLKTVARGTEPGSEGKAKARLSSELLTPTYLATL